MLEKRLGNKAPAKRPDLHVVKPEPHKAITEDVVTRESRLRMIRHLNKRYGMQMLVDQATFGRGSLDLLDDNEIAQLHHDLHRAYDCLCDGVTWEEAGLIQLRDIPPMCPG